jgi:hypothetical protein
MAILGADENTIVAEYLLSPQSDKSLIDRALRGLLVKQELEHYFRLSKRKINLDKVRENLVGKEPTEISAMEMKKEMQRPPLSSL